MHEVATFPTCGGTDVTVLGGGRGGGGGGSGGGSVPEAGTIELIVTNSLTPDLRFAAETVRYELSGGDR